MMTSTHAVANIAEVLNESDLHYPSHRTLWRLLIGMWTTQRPIDLVTVVQAAEDAGIIADVGGGAYIADVFTFVPTAANWREYAEIVRKKSIARRAIEAANRILEAAYDPACGDTIGEVVMESLVGIADFSESKAETKHIRDIMARRLEYFEKLSTGGKSLEGLSTGIPPLDRAIRGLRPGNMLVLAAETKGGKSALALNIACHVAMSGNPVGFFSLEMSEGEIADRLIAAHADVDLSAIADGGLTVTATNRVLSSIARLSEAQIFIRDESVMSPLQFRAAARKLAAQHSVKLLVLDYAQLVQPSSHDDNRERQVAEVSRTVKTTAAELGIPIIVLSQLNDKGRSRESRAIEQDANIFAVIEEDDEGCFLNIRLARDCAKARIPLRFIREFTKFVEGP